MMMAKTVDLLYKSKCDVASVSEVRLTSPSTAVIVAESEETTAGRLTIPCLGRRPKQTPVTRPVTAAGLLENKKQ